MRVHPASLFFGSSALKPAHGMSGGLGVTQLVTQGVRVLQENTRQQMYSKRGWLPPIKHLWS